MQRNRAIRRLYVLISNKLSPVYGCVQGGHAVAEYLLKNPHQQWNNSYLIYLSADLEEWIPKLVESNKVFVEFREPDLDDEVTALALECDGRIFKHLSLVG